MFHQGVKSASHRAARASLGRRKSFVFVAGIQGSKSSPSRHRLHAKFQNFSSTYPPCRYRAPQPTPRRDCKPILVGISGRLGRLCGHFCLVFCRRPARVGLGRPDGHVCSVSRISPSIVNMSCRGRSLVCSTSPAITNYTT